MIYTAIFSFMQLGFRELIVFGGHPTMLQLRAKAMVAMRLLRKSGPLLLPFSSPRLPHFFISSSTRLKASWRRCSFDGNKYRAVLNLAAPISRAPSQSVSELAHDRSGCCWKSSTICKLLFFPSHSQEKSAESRYRYTVIARAVLRLFEVLSTRLPNPAANATHSPYYHKGTALMV
jgi:hypothetical protein